MFGFGKRHSIDEVLGRVDELILIKKQLEKIESLVMKREVGSAAIVEELKRVREELIKLIHETIRLIR